MDETRSITPPAKVDLAPLSRTERRILGVLIEKALTTPDAYPLTANALVTGSNQKSNRDPLMELPPHEVDQTLLALQAKELAIRVLPAGGRTERWKHNLTEKWALNRSDRAVLAELLLRGPQAEGEMRARASRMAEIKTLEVLREILDRLAARGFVRRLSPEGQRRGVMWTHEFYSKEEWAKLEPRLAAKISADDELNEPAHPAEPASPPIAAASHSVSTPVSAAPATAPAASAASKDELAALRELVCAQAATLEALHEQVRRLADEVAYLKDSLGVS